ncbi:ABC transporter permease [Candidatus Bealeia paramacronuclearis]|uniref:ABC transporter permease n=1 Tax=Candidatus Bealeia paramacronuclearis TaxID=1921001 RepID=A0ABZ2C2E0_9PROT|nr:ABC transporter permease [Candidatus Bealeia paramacronuclearis]
MKNASPSLEIQYDTAEVVTLNIGGEWSLAHAQTLESCFRKVKTLKSNLNVKFIWVNFESSDTTGAWVFHEILEVLQKKNITYTLDGMPLLLSSLMDCIQGYLPDRTVKHTPNRFFLDLIERMGKSTIEVGTLAYELLEFLGHVVIALFKSFLSPKRIKLVPFFVHMERIGVNSIPIIAVISFLIGFVFAYQGEEQLHKFGADIYTINLVGLSIVREAGILLAAIVVAGRTGSAITAELGIMKINQEVDAMNVFGLNPLEYLVLPRMLALICIMPFLAFLADVAGLLGGGVWVVWSMGYSSDLYLKQLGGAITQWSFWIGIIKAPVFAFAIGLVSCFEGFRVDGGAESVGLHTTKAVVESIFLVIVADALFSIFFSQMGV